MIYIPDICGTCKGINSTLNLIYDIYEKEIQKENPKQIYFYGTFNNLKIKKEMNDLGISEIDDISLVSEDDILVIGISGVTKEIYEYLKDNNIEYYDGTCLKIQKLKEEITKKEEDGYEIVLISNRENLKVNYPNLVKKESDLTKLNENPHKFIIFDTSISFSARNIWQEKILAKYPEAIIYNVCDSQNKIISSTKNYAKLSDVTFIISDELDESDLEEKLSSEKTYKFKDINEFSDFILKSSYTKKNNFTITGSNRIPLKEIYNYKYLLTFLLFYKEKINELKENQTKINELLTEDIDNELVKKVINDFTDLNKDGKYIRGVLISLGEYLAGGHNKYLNLATAYETFQTSILIHDDIIDNAKLRRGKETIPRRVCREYLNLASDKDYHNNVLTLANSLAICAGDLGFFTVNKFLVDSYGKEECFPTLFSYYSDIVTKTIKGEIIDVYLPFLGKYDLKQVTNEDILEIFHLKTSYYTIIGPFNLGYILGSGSINHKLDNILNKIGLAFQIKDDLLGIYGDESVIGKQSTKDIEEFKQTLMYSYIMNTSYRDDFLKIYGNSYVILADLDEIRYLYKVSGAYDYAVNYLDELYCDALRELDEIDISEEAKDLLKGLLIYLNNRVR